VDGGVCYSEVYEATVAGNTILFVLLYCGNVCVYAIMYFNGRLVREPCCDDVSVSFFQ